MYAVFRVDTIRAAEAAVMARLPEGALMQRAAAGLATVLLRDLAERTGGAYGRRVLLVVGPGNNGGDALFAGVRLLRRGVAVSAWRVAEAVHTEGWAAFVAAGGRECDAAEALGRLGGNDLVVDGVLGIGGRPGLREPVASFARACADAEVPVVAVDLPSGLDADTPNRAERDEPHFVADVSVTFGGRRLCHLLEPARSACGRVEVVDIGLDPVEPDLLAWEPDDVAAAWPFPGPASDKYSRGVVGIECGSVEYRGAGVLAVLGAVHAGAGMVRYTGPAQVADLVRQAAPNVVVGDGRVQARVLGSGWGAEPGSSRNYARVLGDALAERVPLVLDAGALGRLPAGQLGDHVLLTPHAGELAALLRVQRAEVEADPIGAVLAASEGRGCTVLLKGATQYVAAPGDRVATLAVPGPSWTAHAGSGDVLAGIAGTLLAAGLTPGDAALAAASVQALAASRHPGPHPPQRTVQFVASVIGSLRPSRLNR